MHGCHVKGAISVHADLFSAESNTQSLAGIKNFYITLIMVLALSFATDVLDLSWAYDNYLPLMTAAVLFTVCLSVGLFIASHWRRRQAILMAKGGDTGYHLYDWYMGRELNPRIGNLDLKQFCEQIPGENNDCGLSHQA